MKSWTWRQIDLLAAITIVVTVVLGYFVRRTLNPDGVAYLDLANALRRGDAASFVQGYWSPLYPVLLALVRPLSGSTPAGWIASAHLLNVIAVVLTIVVIWKWSRTMSSPWFGRAAIAGLVVCSAEPPRVEALTPDLILLAVMAWIGYEIIVHRGERWIVLGILFGVAYLTKTGTWPWLLAAMLLRTLASPAGAERTHALRSHAVMALVMLCWIVPLSLQSGHFTFGSTGRLNFNWYLRSSDARTPDTHAGNHAKYQDTIVSDNTPVGWANFEDAAWTYSPWSNPDDWSRGVVSERSSSPRLSWLLGYWSDMVRQAASQWLRTLLIFVLIPALWIGRRPKRWQALRREQRSAMLVMVLGAIGIGEYIAVHAEPRLIAPFALLFTLGALDWLLGDRRATTDAERTAVPRTLDRQALSFLGVAVAAIVAAQRLAQVVVEDRRIAAGVISLEAANNAAFATTGGDFAGMVGSGAPTHPRIIVVGPVLPVLSNVYWLGGRVVAQIPPSDQAAFNALDPERQRDVVQQLFHGRADALWETMPDGGFRIVRIR